MMTPPPDSWRPSVVAIIMDAGGKVLLGSPKKSGRRWHFPQGGVGKKESLVEALHREIAEEVGLQPADYRIICSLGGLRYNYRPKNIKSEKWLGQEQSAFLLLCHEHEPATDIETGGEFALVKWLPWRELDTSMFVPFKRPVVEKILASFFPHEKGDDELCPYLERELSPRRYLLEPNTDNFKLDDCDPKNCALFAGGKEEAAAQLDEMRERMMQLQSSLCAERRGRLLILFHGLEASGRDSSVRRIARYMDPFGVRVESYERLAAHELRERDFLWPLHARSPRPGEQVLFDRTPYELLAQQRLDDSLSPEQLERKLNHVVNLERILAEEGTCVLKFYLNNSYEELSRRLEKRQQDPVHYPRLLSGSDYEPLDKHLWRQQRRVSQQILQQSSTPEAPWYIIPADRQWYRNLCVTRIVCETLHRMVLDTEEKKG